MSLFSFSKIKGKWKLNFNSFAFGYGDEWGEPPKEIQQIRFGNEITPALIITTGWEGSGSERVEQDLFLLIKGKIKHVFSYESYYLDKETEKLTETKFRIIASKKKYYDIELKPDRSKRHTYSFNGTEYVEMKRIKK